MYITSLQTYVSHLLILEITNMAPKWSLVRFFETETETQIRLP